ncbi:MAG: hypothetical protein IKL55_06270 [Clostridia bacterium]|nr:hypothetical protein [Clostridia bacterium]
MKRKNERYIGMLLAVLLVAICAIYYCPHKENYTKVVKVATCFEEGQIDTICKKCKTVLSSDVLEKASHFFGDYEIKIKPSEFKTGLEVRICKKCSKEETREYFCEHKITEDEKWIYEKYATPFEEGRRYKRCNLCDAKISEKYTIPELENNSIYICGTDIKKQFTISSFTQSAVDRYNIVYTENSKLGSNNPFVLGHNYGTLGILYQTKIGEHIYLYINGTIEIYEVIISEYGLQNSAKSDIIGQTTGISIWNTYDCKTLHMYTCYGNNRNGRWIVLAKKIY